MSDSGREGFDPVTEDNKHLADEIEEAVSVPSSIEEEMLLEAADLEEIEYGTSSGNAP